MKLSYLNIILLILAALFNATGNVVLKYSRLSNVKSFWIMIFSLFFFGISFFVYSYVLKSTDLTVAYLFNTSLTVLFVAIASFLIFQENFTSVKIAAILMILIGIWLITK